MEGMPRPMTINDALNELAAIEHEILPTGRVDTEPNQLATIREQLLKKEIHPDEAVKKGRDLQAGRQDYN